MNDTIYQRNIPSGSLPVNVDIRPISSSSHCSPNRFKDENEGLMKYNKYNVNKNCPEDVFLPGKGPISHFFNNIDLDSELKNINEIDTKCARKLFKVDPNINENRLSCYKDELVKNEEKGEVKTGTTWCNMYNCKHDKKMFYKDLKKSPLRL